MATTLEGGCLCGAVRYRTGGEIAAAGHCFCTDCRRASGTSHGTHVAMKEADVELSGELRFFDKPADSGNIVSRGFCPECGAAVLSRNAAMPGMVFLRASSLDDPELIAPAMTVFASRAPGWAHIDDSHPVFPGELDFAAAMR
ncbi:GFA family protein [Pontivivens ytuae]|uniref:GFA family protein n=1 Tax=Pontivivens ytuae TaxID=2789856 RepID=A0A7S9QBR1_9RHOB|nr:GFA family protein [Pontivivens ytuae]QPH52597.1 GFA family protein [Pontivivens ytuae]